MDLMILKQVESVLDLYYNRGGFSKTLERAAFVLYDEPFDFYKEFSHFYYESGYQHSSHKKEDLYRILREFFLWRNEKYQKTEKRCLELLEEDLKDTMNPDAVKKFEKKGWDL